MVSSQWTARRLSFWIRISSTESGFSSPYSLQKAVPRLPRAAPEPLFLSACITPYRDETFLPSVGITCCSFFKICECFPAISNSGAVIILFYLITPHVRMELTAYLCDRTCNCFCATVGSRLILPEFDTKSITKKTNSLLQDTSLPPYCFKEDARREKPCITPGRDETLRLFCGESFLYVFAKLPFDSMLSHRSLTENCLLPLCSSYRHSVYCRLSFRAPH